MVTFNEATEILLNKYKDSELLAGYRLPDGYLMSIKPINMESVLDGFFKVNFAGKVSEYSPVMDPDEFKKALSNVIK